MKTNTIIAKATFTASAPEGYKGQLIATAEAELLGGNSHPHFSVTGEISTPREHVRGNAQCCGCLREEIIKAFPFLTPLIALHSSNSDDGEPMHAVANGFYDLAGSVPHHFGEEYHRGNSGRNAPTEAECLTMLAKHLRITLHQATTIRQACLDAYSVGAATVATGVDRWKAGNKAAKEAFAAFCDTLRPQWQQEARDGIALIQQLAAKQAA